MFDEEMRSPLSQQSICEKIDHLNIYFTDSISATTGSYRAKQI